MGPYTANEVYRPTIKCSSCLKIKGLRLSNGNCMQMEKKNLVVKVNLLKAILTVSDQTSIAIMALSPVTTTETRRKTE